MTSRGRPWTSDYWYHPSVQPTAALLLWLFLRSALLPHEPASLTLPVSSLPSSRSAYGWLETTAPQIISSEFDAGGLLVGRAAKVGVDGTSASDTTFRFAGLDTTSALRPGTPIVLPDVVGMSSIDVTRMPTSVATNSPGPIVEWRPLNSGDRIGLIEGFFMPSRFAVTPSPTGAQPVAELRGLADGSVVLGGALTPGRSSALLSAHWSRARLVDRSYRSGRLPSSQSQPSVIETSDLSLMGHFAYTPNEADRATVTVVSQHSHTFNFDPDTRGTAQIEWQHRSQDGFSIRAAGGYQWMQTGDRTPADLLDVDSALDGSVFSKVFSPNGKERVIRGNVEAARTGHFAGLAHRLQFGGAWDRSAMTPQLAQVDNVYESVDGPLVRVWRIDVPATAPHWTSTAASAFAQDRIGTDQIWLEGGVRYDKLSGRNGGPTGIDWSNVFPHLGAEVFDKGTGFGVFGSVSREGARLPAMALAYGDVNAPTASIYRYQAVGQLTQPVLIARVGPGAAGGLTRISPDLVRPTYDVAVGGVKFDRPRFAMGISAVIRTAKHSVRAVYDDPSNYTAVTQPDKNANFTDASDDQQLTAYNRNPGTFGIDAYTLTNPAIPGDNSIYAFDFTAQYRGKRARVAFSAAAVAAKGTAASRGFRADENDPMSIGDVFADPNATVNAAGGRTFFDRGYVGKIAGAFDLPGRFSLGIVTRYQDGQPFSRLAIFPNLNQGAEAVMAYSNGRPTRFTFISTTDVRLQKLSAFGSKQLTLIVDGFNVFNIGREVAEYVIGDANFRTTTLIEPPRTIRVGLRIAF